MICSITYPPQKTLWTVLSPEARRGRTCGKRGQPNTKIERSDWRPPYAVPLFFYTRKAAREFARARNGCPETALPPPRGVRNRWVVAPVSLTYG